jgi:hypothetical protein
VLAFFSVCPLEGTTGPQAAGSAALSCAVGIIQEILNPAVAFGSCDIGKLDAKRRSDRLVERGRRRHITLSLGNEKRNRQTGSVGGCYLHGRCKGSTPSATGPESCRAVLLLPIQLHA